MARRVVADAGPLIVFARIGQLKLLRRIVGNILVPDAVARECIHEASRPGAHAIRRALKDGVLTRTRTSPSALLKELQKILGDGEAAAIVLAREERVPVLLDDKVARRIAGKIGVQVIGTGGVLIRAKLSGLISRAGPIIEELLRAGYRVSADLTAEILKRCGEK